MEVLLKIGRYAGEIKDVAPDIAHQMIADGNATDPRFEGEVPAEPTPVAEVPAEPTPVAEVHVPEVRRRRNRGN